ncbi:MAG: 16S rRNA (cytosine(967)-C(5))-methyltransferase RsmB [Blastocatellia bacterium]|nr:16S rRNA (cytosine(967)-C(5))-methyltransferase RsmB [Blastocatellia bacterium]
MKHQHPAREGAPAVSPSRLAAASILHRVLRDDSYASPLLAAESLDDLSPEDRRLVQELVLGVLRWRGELDYVINAKTNRPAEKLDAPLRVALWLGLYQLRHLERVPEHAAVNESVELVKNSRAWRGASLVNAALRAETRERTAAPEDRVKQPANRLAIGLSHPKWLLERWIERLGLDEATNLARANNEHAPVALRINPLRAPSLARVLEELSAIGVDVRKSEIAPGAFVVSGGHLTPSARGIREGWVYVQDEASQLIAYLVGARAGERVLDIGAAPGGKTSALAASMGNTGRIVAVDVYPSRLATLNATCHRLAANNVSPVAADAAFGLPFEHSVTFDRVLVDAPCSGTGTLRRNPEIKWRLAAVDLERFAGLQSALLDTASGRVRAGGRLVYSTCSVEPEEDEAVAAAFLAAHPEFVRIDPDVSESVRTRDGYVRTFPHVHGADGFFAAVFERGEGTESRSQA